MITDGASGLPDQPANGPGRPPGNGQADLTPSRPGGVRVSGRGPTKQGDSSAAYLWHRLVAADFMNQAMALAGTLLLCAFPFFLVLAALSGRSAATAVARRLGLNQQAAADVGHLFAPAAATSAAVTGLAWAAFIFCGICVSSGIQGLYERVFELDSRGARDMIRQLIWLGLVVGYAFLSGWAGAWVRRGGPVLLAIVALIAFTAVWWFTSWFLLAGRVSWRRLYPCAVATGLFFVGMLAVFSATFSGMVTSGAQKYGPIGTVFALMSWMIAVGVVIILGAVTGLVWQERGLSFRAAASRLRRAR